MTVKLRPEDYRQMSKEVESIRDMWVRANRLARPELTTKAGDYLLQQSLYIADALHRLANIMEDEEGRHNLEY